MSEISLPGLCIALCWGMADVQCSMITLGTMRVTILAQASGMLTLIAFGLVFSHQLGWFSMQLTPDTLPLVLGSLLIMGALSALGYLCLYKAFQSSLAISLVSALVAANGAVSALLSWLFLHTGNLEAIGLIVCGVMLIAATTITPINTETPSSLMTKQQTHHRRFSLRMVAPLLWALVAAISLGSFNFGLSLASSLTHDWFLLLLGSRVCSLIFLACMLAGTSKQQTSSDTASSWKNLALAMSTGLTEMLGLIVLSFSAQRSPASIASVTTIASCSVLLPFGYSIVRGSRLHLTHIMSITAILLGLMTISSSTPPLIPMLLILLGMVACALLFTLHQPSEFPRSFQALLSWFSVSRVQMILSRLPSFSSSPFLLASVNPDTSFVQKTHRSKASLVGSTYPLLRETHYDLPLPSSPSPSPKKKRTIHMGAVVTLLALITAIVFPLLLAPFPSSAESALGTPLSAGTLSFSSSGQIDPAMTMGYNDIVTLSLPHVVSPPSGMADFAWLMPDTADDATVPLLIGRLSSVNKTTILRYVSPLHTNLLALYSGLRVTEQADDHTPRLPSQDPATWRWQGWFPSVPTPGDQNHYSLVSHLRHLLAKDPTLQANALPGGLSIWMTHNIADVEAWASAAQAQWKQSLSSSDADTLHHQLLGILDYVDGSTYVWRDVPQGSPWVVDPLAGKIGLLDTVQGQEPPGYLTHVDLHLRGLANSPGHTQEQQQVAIAIDGVIAHMTYDLMRVRQDAKQLVQLSDLQLGQSSTLTALNEMVNLTTEVKGGWLDPKTNEDIGGSVWIAAQLQQLATIPLTEVTNAT